ncbi:hypothetical protein CEXT_106561 [Caerostris extrusa]|uniref:Uncharacterized protein n=1 Tax=Caerostris extrusa TaxID=172846 RepID=A0AAV4QFY5_CAEEX|nr:hypothetical protein CEXT_106561 [Caerostris extrusa]
MNFNRCSKDLSCPVNSSSKRLDLEVVYEPKVTSNASLDSQLFQLPDTTLISESIQRVKQIPPIQTILLNSVEESKAKGWRGGGDPPLRLISEVSQLIPMVPEPCSGKDINPWLIVGVMPLRHLP